MWGNVLKNGREMPRRVISGFGKAVQAVDNAANRVFLRSFWAQRGLASWVGDSRNCHMVNGFRRFWSALGPGLVTGAADDDPSGSATYSQAGAQFGFALTWTMFLTLPFMAAIQIISAWVGWQTRQGLASNLAKQLPMPVLLALVALLLVANTINIAADLASMGEALKLVIGGPQIFYALVFGGLCLVLEVAIPYHRYAGLLKFIALVLLVY